MSDALELGAGVMELCPGRLVGGDYPCFVIAEIGINHQGDINIAKQMIKVAKVRKKELPPERHQHRQTNDH